MTILSHVDHLGRPLVVVTGMGVVTSLGAGKNENWRRLTRGELGIRKISRFSTEGMRTQIAGSVDFVPAEPPCLTARCENMAMLVAEEALDQAALGTRGDFPGPLFLAIPPAEVNWPQRIDVATALAADGDCNYDALLAAARHTRFAAYHRRLMSASVADFSLTPSAQKGHRFRCRPHAPRVRWPFSSRSKRSGGTKPTPRSASVRTDPSPRRP